MVQCVCVCVFDAKKKLVGLLRVYTNVHKYTGEDKKIEKSLNNAL